MRYFELFEGQNYEAMFASFVDMGAPNRPGHAPILPLPYAGFVRREVKEARRVLQTNDRIVWFLRLFRIGLLAKFADQWKRQPPADASEDAVTKLENLKRYYLYQYAQVSKLPEASVLDRAIEIATRPSNTLTNFEHFLSLPIPEIQNHVFGYDDPLVVLKTFRRLEKTWQDSRKGLIPAASAEQGAEIILQFANGYAWWMLDRHYCEHEAGAMGHCGNGGGNKNDRILSLRKAQKHSGESFYQPYLTFILTPNGRLGEMKGRFNKSPKNAFKEGSSPSNFNDEIYALLKLPLIKGIIGGGFMPQENFKIQDLTPEQIADLGNTKPELMPLRFRYEKHGITPDLVEDVQNSVHLTVSGDGTMGKLPYDPTTQSFEWDWQPSMAAFIQKFVKKDRRHTRAVALWILKVQEGDEDTHHWDFSISDDEKKDLLRELEKKHPEEYSALLQHFTTLWDEEHADEDEEEDDPDLWDMIEALDRDFADEVGWSVEDGLRVGAENEMSEYFDKWITPLKANGKDGWFIKLPEWDENYYDSKVLIMVTFPTALDWIDENKIDEDPSDLFEVDDINEPHYGFTGYDEDAALERLMDHLPSDLPASPN